MTQVLLTSQQPVAAFALGADWASGGEAVTVVLLDGATTVLRPGHDGASDLRAARAAGVRILAHDEAVAERALEPHAGGVELVDIDTVAALIGDPDAGAQWW